MTGEQSALEMHVSACGDGVLVEVAGELDLATRPMLDELIESVTRKPCRVVVNLAQLTFLDSSGIVSLIRLANAATSFELRGATGSVARVLELTQLDVEFGAQPPHS